MLHLFGTHILVSSQINRLERIQHYAARFVANDHRRTTSPTTLVQTLNWQTLERRRTITQAMTFYKILNNIIEINPPTGILTRSHNRHHFTIPRSRLNSVVYSFYPRAIRIWNTIPKEITEIKQPESFHAAISKLPFTTPDSSEMLVTKSHSGTQHHTSLDAKLHGACHSHHFGGGILISRAYIGVGCCIWSHCI